jgi:hypothetical protein
MPDRVPAVRVCLNVTIVVYEGYAGRIGGRHAGPRGRGPSVGVMVGAHQFCDVR